jgi:hypothetical protein
MDARISNGYKPVLRVEDIEIHGDRPIPDWTSAQSADTADSRHRRQSGRGPRLPRLTATAPVYSDSS